MAIFTTKFLKNIEYYAKDEEANSFIYMFTAGCVRL